MKKWLNNNEYDTECLQYNINQKKTIFSNYCNKVSINIKLIQNLLKKFDKKSSSLNNIDFGISILKWLPYGHQPIFKNFKQEILNNGKSTIDLKLYLEFVEQCDLKILANKSDNFLLNELLSLKLYTDTTTFQSYLRKSFWKNTSLNIKKTFYHWAITLYKTHLYHSKPIISKSLKTSSKIPSKIFHGLYIFYFIYSTDFYYLFLFA